MLFSPVAKCVSMHSDRRNVKASKLVHNPQIKFHTRSDRRRKEVVCSAREREESTKPARLTPVLRN